MSDQDRESSSPDRAALPLAREAAARRRRRDVALVLPLLGVVLLASPFANVVAHAGHLAGIPVGVLYVFGVWLALIAATARLAGRLRADDGEG
ncbi:MAG TPA: hypothetical protein PKA33_10185 [Amaricoccus sp.]|uniref:hypothetical protein n=1 Tax=Amaricoccus sp. TaxID=1872485 RepID=UPI002C152D37|nr:hypothetical protein [Amaricoccus sp.]HMQ92001.1 hypothetical protein [Amaricoccus sp.]HMR52784.1 hypothetical protein [Amaricoccus sp.]HMR61607.1 hypothetical protein [Amaricoccus sp.]HMT99719.1 hypothetical protein [Amaricoccus sp.]